MQNRWTLILGIDDPLRGDDGLGPALLKRFQGKVGAVLIDAGDVQPALRHPGGSEAIDPGELVLLPNGTGARPAAGR